MPRKGKQNGAIELLALELAAGQTIRAAAAKIGMGESVAYRRWEKDPEFRQRVSDLRGEMVARAAGVMADGMSEAATTLRELLTAESESTRLGACRALLELGVKIRETVELETRLKVIEEQLAAQQVPPSKRMR